jgi:dihydropteroate synthase
MNSRDFDVWLRDSQRKPVIMGVLNVTPDSFSDGGRFCDPRQAANRALEMAADGADIIDIGGESTRPGSRRVSVAEQVDRIGPVLGLLKGQLDTAISVDTTRALVAKAALESGASIINDVSAGREDADLLPLAAARDAPVILMHMLGTPATMQVNPVYGDVVRDIAGFLGERLAAAQAAGMPKDRLLVDPGIGFGKTVAHNLTILKRLEELRALNRPVVLGVSRKAFIGHVLDEPRPEGRLLGTAACVAWGLGHGADIVRIHDVREISQVVRMIRAIQGAC